MRVVLLLLIWLLIPAGMYGYLQYIDEPVGIDHTAEPAAVPGTEYRLELTTTFHAEPDAFALMDQSSSASAITIRMGKLELFRSNETLEPGEVTVITPLPDLTAGRNEMFLEAVPPVTPAERSYSVRLRLLQKDAVTVDRTYWVSAGGKLAEAIVFDLDHPR